MTQVYTRRYCSNCGATGVHAHGRCAPCHTWWAKHGTERPEDRIVALAKRKMEEGIARANRVQRFCGDIVFLGLDAWTECELAPGHLGDRHRSWLGEWSWDGANLQFSLGHDYADAS